MKRRRGWGGNHGAVAIPAALAVLLAVSACTILPVPEPPRAAPSTDRAPAVGVLSARVVASAYSLLDAPYRSSGDGPDGFDCSGLTRYVFAAAGVALPRTAADQAGVGRWVALDELAPGDLVFFSTADKPSHVGVVVSANDEPLRMIHASTSRGVVETDVLRDPYWLARLSFGRRVLPGG